MRITELLIPAPEHPSALRKAVTALLIHFWIALVTNATTLLYHPDLKLLFDTTPGISSILWATFVIIMSSHLYLIFSVLGRKNWARWMVALMLIIAFISAISSILDFSTAPFTNLMNIVAFGLIAFASRILFLDADTKTLFIGAQK